MNASKIRYVKTSRYGLPKGTPLVYADNQSDPYRVLARGEKFYTQVTDPTSLYGFTAFDLDCEDPYGRKFTPPFFVDRCITVDYDRLPRDKGFSVAYTVDDSGIAKFFVCIDPKTAFAPFLCHSMALKMVKEAIEANSDLVSSVQTYTFKAPFDDAEECTLPDGVDENTYLHHLKSEVNY